MTEIARDRDGLWKLIRTFKRFTLSDLARQSTLDRSSIKTYLRILIKAGYVAERKAGDTKPSIYSLIKDNGVQRPELTPAGVPKAPNGRQRMWSAMKVLKRFTFRDLSLAASVGHADAHDYCCLLRSAKYLKVLEPAKPTCNPEVYALDRTKDTGPLAPTIKRGDIIYDRNLGKVVWPESEAA